jgi:hypothetical protein
MADGPGVIGDVDPEDAYDAGDPVGVRLAVLERIVVALYESTDRRESRRVDALRLVRNLGEEDLRRRDRRRLRAIRDDLEELG